MVQLPVEVLLAICMSLRTLQKHCIHSASVFSYLQFLCYVLVGSLSQLEAPVLPVIYTVPKKCHLT